MQGSADVFDLVLMDGSKCLFYARVNSSVSWKLKGHVLVPGTTIVVTDHQFIWHTEKEAHDWKAVMLINSFKCESAPIVNETLHPTSVAMDSWKGDGKAKDQFDF